MNDPLVSICIPTYNRAEYLVQAIESVLEQDYENIEVVVSDNCSSDDTENVVKKFIGDSRFHYYRNETNVGMVNNWRKMIESLISGEWFVMLSDDDYLIDSSYITNAVELITSNQNIKMVYANGYIEHTYTQKMEELVLPYKRVTDGKEIFLTSHKVLPQAFTLCNLVFNTKLALSLDAFTDPHNLCCDSVLFLRTCMLGDVGVIKDFVSVYRLHGENLITQKRTYEELNSIGRDLLINPQIEANNSSKFSVDEMMLRNKEVVEPGVKDILFCISRLDESKLDESVVMFRETGYDVNSLFVDKVFMFKLFLTRHRLVFSVFQRIKKMMSFK